MARMALSRVARPRSVGSAYNDDNVKVTHGLVQGDMYVDVRAKRSHLLSSSPEIRTPFVVLRTSQMFSFFLSGSFASRQWHLP